MTQNYTIARALCLKLFQGGEIGRVVKRQGGEIGRVVKWQGGELEGGELAGGELAGGEMAGGEMAGGQLGGTLPATGEALANFSICHPVLTLEEK